MRVRTTRTVPANSRIDIYDLSDGTPYAGKVYADASTSAVLGTTFTLSGSTLDFYIEGPSDIQIRITPPGGSEAVLENIVVPGEGVVEGPPGPTGLPGSLYPISAYGFVAATCPPDLATTVSSANALLCRVWIPAGVPISGMGNYVSTPADPGGTGGENSFALYDDDGHKISQTAPDNHQWDTVGYVFRDLIDPVPAHSEGRFVWAGVQIMGLGGVQVLYMRAPNNVFNGGKDPAHIRTVYNGTLSSWPATVDVATWNQYSWVPFIVLT